LSKRSFIENNGKSAGLTGNRLWRTLSSLKLTLILMLVLIGLTLIGTFVIQVPLESARNAADYKYWLEEVAQPQTGVWFPILNLLGLFNVFHSIWFLGAGALLAISIIVCTLNRWKQIKSAASLNPPPGNIEYYLSADHVEIDTSLTQNEVILKLNSIFKVNHYTLKEDKVDQTFYAAGYKNHFSAYGTYLIHLSLILFIIGYLIGSYLGFNNPSFIVAEGETQNVGNGTALSLSLESFTDEYWENGSPKDYRSQVTLLDNGNEVKKGTIQVNHPLSYKGIRFYQSFFGDTAKLDIKDAQGKTIYKGSVALSQTLDDYPYVRPAGSVQTASSGYTLYVVGRLKNIQDNKLAANQIGIEVYRGNSTVPVAATKLNAGEPYISAGLDITYTGAGKFSGFQVSRDPGNSLIWVSSSFFILGLIIVFYFPRRQVGFCLRPDSGNLSKIYLRPAAGWKIGSRAEIKRLEALIKKELN
jgi:cytochrome c biogenesis protein